MHLEYALTGLQVFRQCRDENRDHEVFRIDRCQANHIIYIGSATAGYSWSITWNENSSQCRVGGNSQCITYHQQIMRCNGRRHCSFGRVVFSQMCSQWRVNFIDIRYNCIRGKGACLIIWLFATICWKTAILSPYSLVTFFSTHGKFPALCIFPYSVWTKLDYTMTVELTSTVFKHIYTTILLCCISYQFILCCFNVSSDIRCARVRFVNPN